ncbi:non-ribosomal peptide synthetase [Paenibacillus tarimensis]|uniref:non-ribosomal peptide synthetase n=1 Tax=Paenibacillus tarimensis TaxID=416012 RepID=UPI001F26E00D|nr:non-ribosomal peptide synthetase [Paenibacillus tarimensis]MCF2946283.1 amino acid adenylation domain-containing protein [Paenibacillus tarimensis]
MSVIDRLSYNVMLSDQQFEAERNYWLGQLEGELQFGRFPANMHEAAGPVPMKAEPYRFDPLLTQRIYTLCGGSQAGLYMILTAGVFYLLYKHTGNDDLTVGMPMLRQGEAEGGGHMLALRLAMEEAGSLKSLLGRVKEIVMDADRHQSLPFGAIAAHKQLSWGSDHYFHTSVSLDALHRELPENERSDLHLRFRSHGPDDLLLEVSYDGALYEEETIYRLAGQLQLFLDQALAAPEKPLQNIQLITAAEKDRVLGQRRENEAAYPDTATIHSLFREQASRHPHRTAVQSGGMRMTYQELDQRSDRLAARLQGLGISRDKLVAVLLDRSAQMAVAALAVLKAGGAYVPIDPDYPEDRIAYTLEDSGAEVLVTESRLKERLKLTGGSYTVVEADDAELSREPSAGGHPVLVDHSSPEDLAYVIYTSGTTGRPKGVMIEHRNVVRLLFNDRFQFSFSEHDVWTMFHSFCFDFSVWEMYGALLYGGQLLIVDKEEAKDPAEFLRLLEREGVTVLNQTPSAFYRLVDAAGAGAGYRPALKLRYVVFGGEALNPQLLRPWQDIYPETRLINMYGITETTVHVTFKELTAAELASARSNIGRPIPTLTAYIMDSGLNLLPSGIAGELCIGGLGVARGYLNRPELTSERFVDNPYLPGERLYRSGDLARMLPSGDIEYLGRLDHQVKIRGYRIELGEIENRLLQHPAVNKTVVLTRSDRGQSDICAYYTAEGRLSSPELRDYLAGLLPSYMIPAHLIQISEIPMTPNGKVDRKALPDPLGIVPADELVEPRTELEQQLSSLWAEVAGVKKAGVTSSFFHLGGDSISAITLINRINREFGVQLQIKDLYLHQSAAELGQILQQQLEAKAAQELGAEAIQAEPAEPSSGPDSSRPLLPIDQAWQELDELKERIMGDPKLRALLPADAEDVYPMSDIERGMVYYAIIHTGEGVYHDQFIYHFADDSFELETFVQAVQLMADKHSIFRTSFNLSGFDSPMQVISREVQPDIEWADITALPRREQEERVRQVLKEDLARPFQVHEAPLWRIKLFRIAADQFCMCWIFHHAILDGWSNASFMTELSNTYFRLKEEPAFRPEPLRSDYRSYVAEQLALKADPAIHAFWEQELDGYKRLNLPILTEVTENADMDPAEDQGTYTLALDVGLLHKLTDSGRREGISIRTYCFAAYASMMSMLSYDSDFIVGLIENNRPVCDDSDRLLGCFLNTVPVRVRMERGVTWNEYVRGIHRQLIELKHYGRLPLYEILKAAGEPSQDENPLFDTVFNYVDFHVYEQMEHFSRMDETLAVQGQEKTNTLFDFSILNTFQQFAAHIIYDPSRFSGGQVKRLAGYFTQALRAMAEQPDLPVRKQDILPDPERQQLLYTCNATRIPYPSGASFPDLFLEQVLAGPDRTALRGGGRNWSYRQLYQQAAGTAAELKKMGIGRGDIVGLMSSHCPEAVIGALSVMMAGAAFVPIDPGYPQDRVAHMLRDSGAKLVLARAAEDTTAAQGTAETQVLLLNTVPAALETDIGLNKGAFHDWPQADDLAYIIYTSGSTGRPKGVMAEHRGLANLKTFFADQLGITPEDRVIQFASSSFDASIWEMTMSLLTGASLVIPTKDIIMNPSQFVAYLNDERITVATLPPTYLQQLDPEGIKTLKKLFSAGSAISPKLAEQWSTRVNYYNAYGPTETTICTTVWPYEKSCSPLNTVPIGRPIANTEVYILDDQGQLQPAGIPGELCVAGESLVRGYLNRQELTEEKFVQAELDGPRRLYRTGDLASWLPDGNLRYIGRIDHQVKIRGYRVEPGEIEACLGRMPQLAEAVVIDRTDGQGNTYLCAYYAAAADVTVSEIRQYLAGSLPDYMIPAYMVALEQMPLTPNDKIDRKALPAPETIMQEAAAGELADLQTEMECRLAEVWQEVLGCRAGRDSHFFELGGDSIKAIQLTARLQAQGLELSIRDLFQNPTIRHAACCIRATEHTVDQGPVEGEFLLTPIQRWLFEEHADELHHFNQSVMLLKPDGFDEAALDRAMAEIVRHHDALRAVFRRKGDQVAGWIRGVDEPGAYSLDVHDMTKLENAGAHIEKHAAMLQASMNPQEGPLFKAALFRTGEGDHLLVIVHHLVVDGVSWRILLEDMVDAYQQALEARAIRLPAKTESFKAWSAELHEYAASRELQREKMYWAAMETADIKPLPYRKQSETNRIADSEEAVMTLDAEQTSRLLNQVHHAYNTEMNDLLLAALGMALQDWTGNSRILLQLEGHGREQLRQPLPLGRTVGWFTSAYPVVLDMEAGSGSASEGERLAYRIKRVKEELRQIPGKGMGYGILKYLAPHEETAALKWSLQPEVNFNYLGQFDAAREDAGILTSPYSMGPTVSPDFRRPAVLDVTAMITGGRLAAAVSYNRYEYSAEQMEQLVRSFHNCLQAIIEHCAGREKTELTPSDLGNSKLSLEEVEDIEDFFNNL